MQLPYANQIASPSVEQQQPFLSERCPFLDARSQQPKCSQSSTDYNRGYRIPPYLFPDCSSSCSASSCLDWDLQTCYQMMMAIHLHRQPVLLPHYLVTLHPHPYLRPQPRQSQSPQPCRHPLHLTQDCPAPLPLHPAQACLHRCQQPGPRNLARRS